MRDQGDFNIYITDMPVFDDTDDKLTNLLEGIDEEWVSLNMKIKFSKLSCEKYVY